MEKILSVEDVANVLKIKYATAAKLIREGKIKAVKAGREYRITETNLQKFVNGET